MVVRLAYQFICKQVVAHDSEGADSGTSIHPTGTRLENPQSILDPGWQHQQFKFLMHLKISYSLPQASIVHIMHFGHDASQQHGNP